MTVWNFIKFQRGHINFSVINGRAEIIFAGSMAQLKSRLQQGLLPRLNRFWRLFKLLSRRIWIHLQNGFSPWIRVLRGVDWWKTEGQKSHVTVSLIIVILFKLLLFVVMFTWSFFYFQISIHIMAYHPAVFEDENNSTTVGEFISSIET
jgi:hypothetical protein